MVGFKFSSEEVGSDPRLLSAYYPLGVGLFLALALGVLFKCLDEISDFLKDRLKELI